MPLTYRQYLIATLGEEASEVAQMTNKLLRFWNDDLTEAIIPPEEGTYKEGAYECLMKEIMDFLVLIDLMVDEDMIIEKDEYGMHMSNKRKRVLDYWTRLEERRTKNA